MIASHHVQGIMYFILVFLLKDICPKYRIIHWTKKKEKDNNTDLEIRESFSTGYNL